MPWFVPLIMSLVSTAVGAGTSIASSNKQLRFQEKQLAEQQRLEQENINNQRLMNQQQQQINNQNMINQFASNLNKGYSTGLIDNQIPAMAKVGGLFSKKDNAKSTVRDDNNLYFDRIEYAKCGGRFSRK